MRLVAGRNGTPATAATKMPKVGVAPPVITVAALGPAAVRHCPVVGLVWQIEIARGKLAGPVSAAAVIIALAPKFTVATAKALDPELPGMCRMPSLLAVAASATMSGTGVAEADSSKVLTPGQMLEVLQDTGVHTK